MKINYSLPAFSFNMKNIKLILMIITLYLLFLIARLPATVVLSMINFPSSLTLTSISGTAWSGSIKNIRYAGLNVGSIKWSLHPLNLIIGELSADIAIMNDEQYINTEVNLSSSGKIVFEETRFLIYLSALQPLTYGMPFSYAGKISGYLPVSFIHKNNYVGINGKISLDNMEMISPQRQSFGDFYIDFRAENEGATSGRIKDSGGLLHIDGQLNLKKNGLFHLSAKLAAREKDSSLERVISFLGPMDADGRIQVNSNFMLWH